MRSVRETITNGITTLPQLQESLQTAMQLEFSTIPPYLCTQWSSALAGSYPAMLAKSDPGQLKSSPWTYQDSRVMTTNLHDANGQNRDKNQETTMHDLPPVVPARTSSDSAATLL
jgi:hypothetical protein